MIGEQKTSKAVGMNDLLLKTISLACKAPPNIDQFSIGFY